MEGIHHCQCLTQLTLTRALSTLLRQPAFSEIFADHFRNAFREICAEEGFDDFLQATLDRIGDIESLGRTRELTIKDLWEGGKYRVKMQSGGLTFECEKPKEEDDEEKADAANSDSSSDGE